MIIRTDTALPFPQHRGHEPARQTFPPHAETNRVVGSPDVELTAWISDLRSDQRPRELDGAGDPIGPHRISAQAPLPIEIHGSRLERRSDIAQTRRSPGAVTQPVNTQNAQVIFGAGNAD